MKHVCRLAALLVLLVALFSLSANARPLILCDQLNGRACTSPNLRLNCVWFTTGGQGSCTCQTASSTWSCS